MGVLELPYSGRLVAWLPPPFRVTGHFARVPHHSVNSRACGFKTSQPPGPLLRERTAVLPSRCRAPSSDFGGGHVRIGNAHRPHREPPPTGGDRRRYLRRLVRESALARRTTDRGSCPPGVVLGESVDTASVTRNPGQSRGTDELAPIDSQHPVVGPESILAGIPLAGWGSDEVLDRDEWGPTDFVDARAPLPFSITIS